MSRGDDASMSGYMRVFIPAGHGLAWIIQVSDTHFGAFDDEPQRLAVYGDKKEDLRLAPRHCCPERCCTCHAFIA